LQCVREYESKPEVCDDIDNDCSGAVDDGHPQQMGSPPAAYAAELGDRSFPASLAPGESASVWASFVNRGASTWKQGKIWLATKSASEGKPSPMFDSQTWPAWNVAATLVNDVAPGQTAYFQWEIRMPNGASTGATETFTLTLPPNVQLRCPEPDLSLNVRVGVTTASTVVSAKKSVDVEDSGCTCRAAPSRSTSQGWLVLMGMGLAALVRRRSRRSS
jgi:MYXO-CTERM domain-containing protein